MNNHWIIATAAVSALLGGSLAAGDKAAFTREQLDFFESKIRPVLAEQCFKCHSERGEKIKGGLVLDSRAAMLKGGDTGPAVTAGDPEKSLIIQAIRYTDEDLQMPPKHRLTPEQVKAFEEWVKMGAPDPRDGAAPRAAGYDWHDAKKFWSFQPVKDAPVPAVQNASWPRNDVDQFVLAKLEERALAPSADADKRTLLRRATYDLIGLPPTPDERRAFIEDASPDAFTKVVDRLLASPHYGEQWGRHWLDVVRYADTSGCNSDFPVPSAHRYRDYVIDAFNRDKPYDQFLREQIAGDLLPADNTEERFEKIVATGYLAIARRFGSRANEFHLTMEDLLDNLGRATLGLSLGCARCHDHKFDPVPARDYYALYGIFESTKFAFPGTEIYRHTKDFTPLVEKTEAEKRSAEAAELAALDDQIENLKNEKRKRAREEKKAAEAKGVSVAEVPLPSRNPEENTPLPIAPGTTRTAADVQVDLDAARIRQEELVKHADSYPKAYAVFDGKPVNARIQKKGEPGLKGDEVPRGFLTVLGAQTLPADEKGSGRKHLADWLTDRRNPLTARVMVNRIWQHHFGKGLVKSPNDFGVRGDRPTHPELLDWLAARFVESGWSVKAMHRLIMLSRAYQMSSEENEIGAAKDPANDLLWRFNRRRLKAEELRDSILAVSGALDPARGGGHAFPPEGAWRYTQHKPFLADPTKYETNKRSVYLMQQRIRKQPYLDLFDGADTNATTAVRPVSHTPLQALWLMNNDFAHDQALRLGDRLYAAFPEDAARVNYAFELALGRLADTDELRAALDSMRAVTEALKETAVPADQHARVALASFSRVLLSANEFMFVD